MFKQKQRYTVFVLQLVEGEYSTVQWCAERIKTGGHLCEQQASEVTTGL